MIIKKPAYFDQFRCLAAQCPDSCCQQWAVCVDPDTAARYRTLPGSLGDELRSAMCQEDGDLILALLPDQRCPMWRHDGLCRIQAELGHDALCKTCREFPRLTHDYGTFIELGLELSCPEAARLILTSSPAPWTVTSTSGNGIADYDREAMDILLHTRETALALVYNTQYSVPEVLVLLLFWGYQAQSLIDGIPVPEFSPETVLTQASSMAVPGDPDSLLQFFGSLELLTAQWKQRLQSPAPAADWSNRFRALARYGIERYWLQAVSDYDLTCRVKMILLSCLLVKHLGGDFVSTAQLYSKEIENDTLNVEAILDAAYTHPALTDEKLLGLLLFSK